MYNFLTDRLSPDVKTLEVFCDSCAGQNKNFTLFRFMHWIDDTVHLFDSIKMVCPARGHSYMECVKNFGLLNERADAEVPADWLRELRVAREKPSPFAVIECEQNLLKGVKDHLVSTKVYKLTCPFHTRPFEFLWTLVCSCNFKQGYAPRTSCSDNASIVQKPYPFKTCEVQ